MAGCRGLGSSRTSSAQEKEWLSAVRDVYKLLPGYRATWQHASAILVASEATWQDVPARHRHKCFYVPENAIDPIRFTPRPERPFRPPLKVVFVGRLVPLKGVDMLLEAAAPLIKCGSVHVAIVGDGPHMPDLRQLIAREGIEGGVSLPGWVEHVKVQEFLRDADVLGFPSVHDFGGGAVLEAMAMGLVPIVVDYGGPGELVTEGTGYKVAMGDRASIVREYRRILGELATDPAPLAAKSRMCLRRCASSSRGM